LDIIGDDQKTGKTTGTDADKGKLTLAVIHSRSCLKKTKRPDEQTVSLLKKCGSLEYANDKAKHFAAKAIDSLSGIGDSRAKDALIEMAKFAANRAEHNLRA
ncbi:MAG: hypothetical protein ACYST9_03690, partial [Planctomycetota bacterium]